MSENENQAKEESGAHHLAALLRQSSTSIVDGEKDSREWKRLLAATDLEDQHAKRRVLWRPWVVVPVSLGLAVATLVLVLHFSPPPLAWTMDGKPVAETYFATDVKSPLRLDFSDGSQVRLSTNSQVRLSSPKQSGATIQLEQGRVDVAIRHRADTRWRLEAGPYAVQITGTRFLANWDPATRAFDVELQEGSVNVMGSEFSMPLPLKAGQNFRVNRFGKAVIQPSEGIDNPFKIKQEEEKLAEKPPATTSSERSESTVVQSNPLTMGPRKVTCTLSPLFAQGKFEYVVAQAKTQGLHSVLADCPISELFDLADAARYLRNLELSADTLHAIRRRSPKHAPKAAFLLGRLEEARGRSEQALQWYGLSLSEGSDAYRTESMAGKLRMEKLMGAGMPTVDKQPLEKVPGLQP